MHQFCATQKDSGIKINKKTDFILRQNAKLSENFVCKEMDNYSTLKEIRDRLLSLFPTGALKTQFQSKIDATLKSAFEEFGLITQEELSQQAKVLERANSRIDELEKILFELESKINEAD